MNAVTAPFKAICKNAGVSPDVKLNEIKFMGEGFGYNAKNDKIVEMIETGIIDPVLVTKAALKNAVSVVSTIISADCVISNMRINESN